MKYFRLGNINNRSLIGYGSGGGKSMVERLHLVRPSCAP
jgi:hypothetical protein